MKALIFLSIIALARARVLERCSGVEINGHNYETEVLKDGLNGPYQLAIDYDTNYLFFSYSSPTDLFGGFKSAYINLKTNEFKIIRGITGGFANAVDQKNHVVYLGGNDGIYTFDFNTDQAKFLGVRNTSIWQLHFKDKLYFTTYPNEDAFTFENGVSKRIPELIATRALLLVVDENDDFIFNNSSGLFIYKKDKNDAVYLGSYNVNGYTKDINNNVFFSTPDGLYSIDQKQDVTKLVEIPSSVYGLAIEADNNIIYADSERIVRLKQTTQKCIRNINSIENEV